MVLERYQLLFPAGMVTLAAWDFARPKKGGGNGSGWIEETPCMGSS